MEPVRPLAHGTIDEKLDRIAEMLLSIADEEPGTRRRLRALRGSEEYRAAYTTPDPLVTVVIPTYTSHDTLRDVALPSVLAQTHEHLEVIVVGDGAPAGAAAAVAAVGDPRVRFLNLPYNGPYPEDPHRRWLVTGTPPFNAGVEQARGAWIAPLGDDDAFLPGHVERLLAEAREQSLELVYGRLRVRLRDMPGTNFGAFPPRHGEFGLQGALYHAGLSFMELRLSDELFGLPNDWSLCRRMLRAGVRIGMVDAETVEYFPAAGWGRREIALPASVPSPADDLAAERERAADLARRLHDVTSSKSWRMTAPLRAGMRRLRSLSS